MMAIGAGMQQSLGRLVAVETGEGGVSEQPPAIRVRLKETLIGIVAKSLMRGLAIPGCGFDCQSLPLICCDGGVMIPTLQVMPQIREILMRHLLLLVAISPRARCGWSEFASPRFVPASCCLNRGDQGASWQ